VESSLLYFCSKVVDYNKVTLTGECADESVHICYPSIKSEMRLIG